MPKRKPKKLTPKMAQARIAEILLPLAEKFAANYTAQIEREAEWRRKNPLPTHEEVIPPGMIHGLQVPPAFLQQETARVSRDFLQGAVAAMTCGHDDLAADLVGRAKQVLGPVVSAEEVAKQAEAQAAADAAREALMAGTPVKSAVAGADAAIEFTVPDHDTLNLLGLRKALGVERGQVLQIDILPQAFVEKVPEDSVEIRVNDKRLLPGEKPPFYLWQDDLMVRNLGDHAVLVRVHYRLAPETTQPVR